MIRDYSEGWRVIGELADLMDAVERRYREFADEHYANNTQACSGLLRMDCVEMYATSMVRDVLRTELRYPLQFHADSIYSEYGDLEREIAIVKPLALKGYDCVGKIRISYSAVMLRYEIEGVDWALGQVIKTAKVIGCDEIEVTDINNWLEKLLSIKDPYAFEEYLYICEHGMNIIARERWLERMHRAPPVKEVITGSPDNIRKRCGFAVREMNSSKAEMNYFIVHGTVQPL